MVVVWPNDDGTFSLSHRYGRPNHVEPVFIPTPLRVARAIPPGASSVNIPDVYTTVLLLNVLWLSGILKVLFAWRSTCERI